MFNPDPPIMMIKHLLVVIPLYIMAYGFLTDDFLFNNVSYFLPLVGGAISVIFINFYMHGYYWALLDREYRQHIKPVTILLIFNWSLFSIKSLLIHLYPEFKAMIFFIFSGMLITNSVSNVIFFCKLDYRRFKYEYY